MTMDLFSMRLGWGYRFEGEYGRKEDMKGLGPAQRGYVREPNREVRVKMPVVGYIEAEEKLATETEDVLRYLKEVGEGHEDHE